MLASDRRTSPESRQRTLDIQREYADGSYEIPSPEQIATAMLSNVESLYTSSPASRERSLLMALIATKPLATRDPGPYAKGRVCPSCKAQLRTTNPGPLCDPCRTPEAELIEDETAAETAARFLASLPFRQREKAMEALGDWMEAGE